MTKQQQITRDGNVVQLAVRNIRADAYRVEEVSPAFEAVFWEDYFSASPRTYDGAQS